MHLSAAQRKNRYPAEIKVGENENGSSFCRNYDSSVWACQYKSFRFVTKLRKTIFVYRPFFQAFGQWIYKVWQEWFM